MQVIADLQIHSRYSQVDVLFNVDPGYDGVFGKVEIFEKDADKKLSVNQQSLF